MAEPEKCLLFQDSLVRLRVSTAEGVQPNTFLLVSDSPVRLEIVDGRAVEGENEALTLLATIHGGKEEDPSSISSDVPITIPPGGTASLRLDSLLSLLIGAGANKFLHGSEAVSIVQNLIASGKLSNLEIFRVAVRLTPSRVIDASRLFPLSSVTLRVEGIDFHFAREVLSLHSEFFCALLFGSFSEGGKDFLTLDSFSAEEIRLLHNVIQRGKHVEDVKSMMALVAIADRILCSGLKARMESLPIPDDIDVKEEWLLDADKYGLFDMASRIIQTIPVRDSAALNFKLFDSISNREVLRLLAQRVAGQLPKEIFINMQSRFGFVRIRFFAENLSDDVAWLQKLPRQLSFSFEYGRLNGQKLDSLVCRKESHRMNAEWKLCRTISTNKLYLKNITLPGVYEAIGEVVEGAEILDGPLLNCENESFTVSVDF